MVNFKLFFCFVDTVIILDVYRNK